MGIRNTKDDACALYHLVTEKISFSNSQLITYNIFGTALLHQLPAQELVKVLVSEDHRRSLGHDFEELPPSARPLFIEIMASSHQPNGA